MNRITKSTVAASLFFWAGSFAVAENPDPAPVLGKIKWVYSYEEGKRLSSQTGKPMFVVFRCER